MKKVVVLTLHGYTNYGNRLQLFALTRTLKTLYFDVMVYRHWRWKTLLKEFLRYYTVLRLKYRKECKLKSFTKKYIPRLVGGGSVDYSIVGSDQVWNPNWLRGFPYLLDVPFNGRKISYAASIGVENLSNEQKTLFRANLCNFDFVSVRENSARVALQSLTSKEIEVVLDPTLLLDKSDYAGIEKKPKDIRDGEKYILCYILGNREHLSAIQKYAEENNCRVILFSDKKESDYGVEEFLYLIHHAELICTDSFHACVFSFIFERPFVAFRRTGEADYMYSRLQNLIDTFKLKGREFNGRSITEKNIKVDYTEAKGILKKEREKSLQFLKNALGVKDEGR